MSFIDLDCTLQQEDLKKAVKGHRMPHSTTNELGEGSEALTDCVYQKDFTHRLQIHRPGLHITAKRPRKSGQRPQNGGCSAINELEVGAKTFTDCAQDIH